MNLKNLNSVQKIGLAITLLALVATVYSFWPHLTPPKPLAGTYLSKTDMDLSWITITEGAEKGQISCAWYQMQTTDKGVVQEHRVTLEGTVNGKNISLSKTLPGQVELSGSGLREKDNIRLSLRMRGKVIYTGEYEPSDELSMVAAASDFNKNAARLAQDWNQKLQARATGGKTAQDQADMHRKMIEQSNAYIRKMDEVIKSAPAVQDGYRSNTEKAKAYLDNVRRIPGASNAAMRNQLVFMMVSIMQKTQDVQDAQEEFAKFYTREILPFFDSLTAQQKICNDAKARGQSNQAEQDLCTLAGQAQQSLVGYGKQAQDALAAITITYRTEIRTQQGLITQAKAVQ